MPIRVSIEPRVGNPRVTAVSCIRVTGVNIWSPPDKPDLRFPFLMGSNLECLEMGRRGPCYKFGDMLEEDDLVYCYNVTGSWKHRNMDYFLARPREGSRVEKGLFYLENLEPIVDKESLDVVELKYEARKRNLLISNSKKINNYIALYILKHNLFPSYDCDAEEPNLCSIRNKIKK